MGLVHSKAHHIVWPPSRWQRLQEQFPHHRLNNHEPTNTRHLSDHVTDEATDHLCVGDSVCNINNVYTDGQSHRSWHRAALGQFQI